MSFIFILFLLFVFWFFIRPLLKVLFGVYRIRRQMKDIFGQYAGTQTRNSGRTSSGKSGDRQPYAPRKKKIDPSVGEYVAFEEIECKTETSRTGTDSTTTRTEDSGSRIEDVEWEDIK